jgi:N-acetylmuramoyl-L-alanine amidase
MAFAVKTHVLCLDDKPVAQKKTPNMGGALTRPSLLVMHFTASQRAAGAISWLCNPAAKASAQIVIDVDGTVTQLMPLNRIAWHAGLSKWKGKSGCNAFSIGIEMANPGLLRRLGNDKFADAYGHSVPAAQVATVNGRYWALYPKSQQDAAVGVAQAIIAAYPTIREIVGHSDIAPGRKIDPGDAWPMEGFRSKVFGRK